MKTLTVNTKYFAILSLSGLMTSSVLFAQQHTVPPPPILDGTIARFSGFLKQAETALYPSFTWLFWTLVIISLAWSMIQWALDESELKSYVSTLTKKILMIGFMSAAFVNAGSWSASIIGSFKMLAGVATQNASMSPSYLFDSALFVLVQVMKGILYTLDATPSILMVCIGIAIVICYALIVGNMILVLIECQFVALITMILAAFGGAEFTFEFAKSAWRYVLSVGLKTFFIFLLASIAETLIADAVPLAQTGKVAELTSILGASIVLTLLIFMIPSNVQSIIAGATLTGNVNAAQAMTQMAGSAANATIGAAKLATSTNSYAAAMAGGNAISYAKHAMSAIGKAGLSNLSNKAAGKPGSNQGSLMGRMGEEISKMSHGLKDASITPTNSDKATSPASATDSANPLKEAVSGANPTKNAASNGQGGSSGSSESNPSSSLTPSNKGDDDISMAFKETALSEQDASDSVGGFKEEIPKGQSSAQSDEQ